MTDLVLTDALALLPALLGALAGGALLGAAFYGSLWWTVRRGLPSARPALWFMIGMAVRMSVALAGLYLIGDGHWERLVTGLAGFVLARAPVVWLIARLSRAAATALDSQRS